MAAIICRFYFGSKWKVFEYDLNCQNARKLKMLPGVFPDNNSNLRGIKKWQQKPKKLVRNCEMNAKRKVEAADNDINYECET